MANCKHTSYKADVNVEGVTVSDGSVAGRLASVRISCAECGMPFWFAGAKTGRSFQEPATSTDGFQLVVPLIEANQSNVPHPELTSVITRNSDMTKGKWRP